MKRAWFVRFRYRPPITRRRTVPRPAHEEAVPPPIRHRALTGPSPGSGSDCSSGPSSTGLYGCTRWCIRERTEGQGEVNRILQRLICGNSCIDPCRVNRCGGRSAAILQVLPRLPPGAAASWISLDETSALPRSLPRTHGGLRGRFVPSGDCVRRPFGASASFGHVGHVGHRASFGSVPHPSTQEPPTRLRRTVFGRACIPGGGARRRGRPIPSCS